MQVSRYSKLDEPIFFDRSNIDVIAYTKHLVGEVPQEIQEKATSEKYNLVYLLYRLPFVNDGLRIEKGDEEAETIHKLILKTYKACGYEPIILPVSSIEQRANKIISDVRIKTGDDLFLRGKKYSGIFQASKKSGTSSSRACEGDGYYDHDYYYYEGYRQIKDLKSKKKTPLFRYKTPDTGSSQSDHRRSLFDRLNTISHVNYINYDLKESQDQLLESIYNKIMKQQKVNPGKLIYYLEN